MVKHNLKQAVSSLIHDEITARPKEGFVLPVFGWLEDKLKDYCTAVLSQHRLKKHDLLNPDTVAATVNSFYSGDRSQAGRVWNLMMFQLWWEEYFG